MQPYSYDRFVDATIEKFSLFTLLTSTFQKSDSLSIEWIFIIFNALKFQTRSFQAFVVSIQIQKARTELF